MSILYLAGCTFNKNIGIYLAKDLYMKSDLFQAARSWVEKCNLDWAIVSTKYGIAYPTQLTQDYPGDITSYSSQQKRELLQIITWQLQYLTNYYSNVCLLFNTQSPQWIDIAATTKNIFHTQLEPLRGMKRQDQINFFLTSPCP